MATVLIRTNPGLARVATSRLVTIPTSPATQIVIASGPSGCAIFNVGPTTLVWGDSNITASSGGLLYYSMQKEWLAVADTFTFFLVATSAAGTVMIHEYA